MKERICKQCGSDECLKDRLLCKECNNKRAREHYKKQGKKVRRKPNANCDVCGESFKSWRKSQVTCPSCHKKSLDTGYINQYTKVGSKNEHRLIAENLLKRKLTYNEVVHHVDEDVTNNSLENLWVMSRHMHGKLHIFLRKQKLIYEKASLNTSSWETIRNLQTHLWLEVNNVKVEKLVDSEGYSV